MADNITWIRVNLLRFEGDVRKWVRRSCPRGTEEDDVIQEAYARIAAAPDLGHVRNPRAYFLTVVRHIALEQLRRAKIAPIMLVEDFGASDIIDESASPDRIVAGRQELRRIAAIVEAFPEKVREIFQLRRIQGLPQKEIARRLCVPESTVEKRAAKGLAMLLAALRDTEDEDAAGDDADAPARRPGGGAWR